MLEEVEVIETTKKALLVYKENLNSVLDTAIAMATGQVRQGKEVSTNPQKTF